MIVTKIHNGLGNQMFQYAAGRRLAARRQTELRMDLWWFRNHEERKFGLDCFNIEGKPASALEILRLRGCRPKDWQGYRPGDRVSRTHVIEAFRRVDPSVLEAGKHAYLQGYFQSEQYFADQDYVIRKDFTLREPLSARFEPVRKAMASSQSVSVHVRRQDYKNQGLHQYPLPVSYYAAAMRYIASRVSKPHFFLFSDEPNWAATMLSREYPVSMVTQRETRDYEEMKLMSDCRHHIIANSSFSWWGAWLDPRKDKIVIAPKQWIREQAQDEFADLLPKEWIQL